MPKFKDKVIRKADGGKYYQGADEGAGNYNMVEDLLGRFAEGAKQPLSERMSNINKFNDRKGGPIYELNKIPSSSSSKTSDLGMNPDIASLLSSRSPKPPMAMAPTAKVMAPAPRAVNTMAGRNESPQKPIATQAPKPSVKKMMDIINDKNPKGPTGGLDYLGDSSFLTEYAPPELKSVATSMPTVATPDMSKMAGNIPKTKSGMKKFMDEYGKFIALGALAGAGGKKGMIAAPIIAALPGILKMLQNRGKKTTGAPSAPATASAFPDLPKSGGDYAHGGLLGNKSAAHPKKKMAGGAIRKFKGGSMNTMKENLVPQYKKGGNMPKGMPKEMMAMMGKKYKKGGEMSKGMSQGMMDMMGKKGKATGDMPEHKKMDMGMPIGKMPDSKKMGMAKPKPSSMNQKFAKGGTAKYASGGMCKGYGIAKKIRSTGVMN